MTRTATRFPRGAGKAGNICIRNPWPGIFQTIWGDPDRFVRTYYARYCKNRSSTDWRDWPYFAGDGAVQAADGYYRILGRIDDVINVAGHRLGTKEIESAALTVAEVAEAAVVPVRGRDQGRVPDLYVSLEARHRSQQGARASASPTRWSPRSVRSPGRAQVWIVPDMPKTRSGKIMRRVLAAISSGQDAGDVTTLANPEVVEELRKMAKL